MDRQNRASAKVRTEAPKLGFAELMLVLRSRGFPLMVGGMFLVNVPAIFAASQLKLVVMDGGATNNIATWLVSVYAGGTLLGRFLSGVALDRISPQLVALAALGLPAFGYLILATYTATAPFMIFAVLLIGLAQGAEGDIGAYMIARRFDLKNFSLLLSCLQAMIGAGGVVGSIILSASLRIADNYQIFLVCAAITTVLGAMMFVMAGGGPRIKEPSPASAEAAGT